MNESKLRFYIMSHEPLRTAVLILKAILLHSVLHSLLKRVPFTKDKHRYFSFELLGHENAVDENGIHHLGLL